MNLPPVQIEQLRELGLRLISQHSARVVVPAKQEKAGYWFGGGNIIQESGGRIVLCGRYRNAGDSTTGTGAGERGLEFAVFAGNEKVENLDKILSFSKKDLAHSSNIVSIEGGCLIQTSDKNQYELFISTEKQVAYPKSLINFQKPGTGVWSIDLLTGQNPESIELASIRTVASSTDSGTLHAKDPVVFCSQDGHTELLYCNHPFSWSSSNTGLIRRKKGETSFGAISDSVLSRGNCWDVACSRVTERLSVPKIGSFAGLPNLSLYFYDGAECLRPLEQNPQASKRPRGYSCEELGGLAWGWDSEFPKINPISKDFPLFISPHASGCSRYVSAIFLQNGDLLATWQQAQPDGSQPLVAHKIDYSEVKRILTV